MMYAWKCRHCDVIFEINRPMAECGVPPPDNDPEYDCGCPDAETAGRFVRVFEPPMIMQHSYLDGKKRPGFSTEIRAAKLEVDKADLPVHKRGAIQKEINDLRKAKS